MAVERVVVSPEEISQVEEMPGDSPSGEDLGNAGMGVGRPGLGGPGRGPSAVPISGYRKLPSPVPLWARILLSFLVLVLPLLCVLTIILRIAFRSQPPRVKYAWVSFLATLLTISGFLTVGAAVVVISLVPVPVLVNTGLPDLDEKSQFPDLPSAADLTSSEASAKLKPLVIVVSPATRLWNRQEVPSGSFGAGVLLHADRDGYLFATANHVADSGGSGLNTSQWSRSAGKNSDSGPNHALIATAAGIWATGNVVAQAPELDLALLWIPRHGNGTGAGVCSADCTRSRWRGDLRDWTSGRTEVHAEHGHRLRVAR